MYIYDFTTLIIFVFVCDRANFLPSFECFLADLTPQEIHKIREAIKNASSLQEVERLTRMLQSGQIPGQKPLQVQQSNGQRKISICFIQLLYFVSWITWISEAFDSVSAFDSQFFFMQPNKIKTNYLYFQGAGRSNSQLNKKF